MPHRSLAALAGLVLTAGTTWLVAAPVQAAAPTTCQGKPVTIVATRTVTVGTEGDDVVAMEPGGWTRFDALGGNDTVCLALPAEITTDHYGGRDRIASVDAGAGDDTVVNLMPVSASVSRTTVVLGLGSDTFKGADVGEVVHAEALGYGGLPAADPAMTGPQRDVVTGVAEVWSTAPVDGPNTDRITFGSHAARAVIDGRMSGDGLLDVSAAPEATLVLPSPDRLRPVTYGGVLVDNQARQVVAGFPTLTWVGDFQSFEIGSPTRVLGAAVSFLGSDAADFVYFKDTNVGDVALGGGDDYLSVQGLSLAELPDSSVGGPGRDTAYLEVPCQERLVVRLDDMASCDGRSGTFTGFEVVGAGNDGPDVATTLVGTARSDDLRAYGNKAVVVVGGGGSDQIFGGAPVVRVRAGGGADRVIARGLDVVVRGQAGPDRVELVADRGALESGVGHRQRVALGGPGADRLTGAADRFADRLVGGAGRDRADGGKGRRDYCTAEVTRGCERP
ncbi:hypothetical protein [Nocardioides zhouii]|nr:hypothetical protein [Nocardioides zhouii]